MDAETLFWARVDKSKGVDGCWLFQGKPQNNGYYIYTYRLGKITISESVHRFAYMRSKGIEFLPRSIEVDHCCPGIPNRQCCNPKHLQLVTKQENIRLRDTRRKL